MKNKVRGIFLATIGLLILSVPALAHHGAAAFDTDHPITMKATVTTWFWANPHCFVKFDYKNEKGELQHWVVETSNPPDMMNKGWSDHTLKEGMEITVTVSPSRNGRTVGRLITVVLPDGQTLRN